MIVPVTRHAARPTLRLLFALTLASQLAMRPGPAAGEVPESKLELLASHRTLARFEGAPYQLCRGRTARCPKQCGNSGEFATFAVIEYLEYQKLGKYGDPKQQKFRFQVSDFNRKPKGDAPLLAKIRQLKQGDRVLLQWHHRYGEVRPGLFSPVRPVVELRKVSEDEAAQLRKEAN